MKRYIGFVFLTNLCILLHLLSACSSATKPESERKLKIVYTNWSEGIAITYLSKVLLESELDYKVSLKLTDLESAYQEVANGNADIFLDAWLPETQKQLFDLHSNSIELIGITYPDAKIGLVVPEYSQYHSISDLLKYTSTIVGIEPDAGIMIKAQSAINAYNLKSKLIESSEQNMIQQLEDSIKRKKEIVITGWEPHWIFARYKVRFLKDPKHIFGTKENIYTVAHKHLEEQHPNAVRLFERMQLTENQINSLVFQIQLNEDPIIGVRAWIKQNEFVVNQWLKNLSVDREKIM